METVQEQGRKVGEDLDVTIYSPIAKFRRVWMIAEKVSVSVSILLVICTIGYLSMHALA